MGSACIKVTKYFLFLFNLLFFVSMTGTIQLPRKESLFLGASQSKTFQPGADGGGVAGLGPQADCWKWKQVGVEGDSQRSQLVRKQNTGPLPQPFPLPSSEAMGAVRVGGGRGENGIFLVRS